MRSDQDKAKRQKMKKNLEQFKKDIKKQKNLDETGQRTCPAFEMAEENVVHGCGLTSAVQRKYDDDRVGGDHQDHKEDDEVTWPILTRSDGLHVLRVKKEWQKRMSLGFKCDLM